MSGSIPATYFPLETYAAIGNCRTAALISHDGVVSFWCPGRFDAPAALLQLLDANQGGFFSIAPEGDGRALSDMRYLPDTNILSTSWRLEGNAGVVTDFMPVRSLTGRDTRASGFNGIVRLVECVSGEMTFRVTAKITPDFANPALPLTIKQHPKGVLLSAGEQHIILGLTGMQVADLHQETDPATRQPILTGTVTLKEGERAAFALGAEEVQKTALTRLQAAGQRSWDQELRQSISAWRSWVGQCSYTGSDAETVRRSLLALKLMQYEPSGAFVAALTTSLPEEVGGERNWDYRLAWLRDSSLTADAFMATGFLDEVAGFLAWLTGLRWKGECLQLMYRIDGGTELVERVLPHLEGYMESFPVREGNEAAEQVQLDSYGYLLDTIHRFGRLGGFDQYPHLLPPMLRLVRKTGNFICANWQQPDNSLWEIRDVLRHYVSGKVMCWTALDRAISFIEAHQGRDDDVARWEEARDTLREQVWHRGYSEELETFTQSYGSSYLDASLLLIPQVGFIDPSDPRMIGTVKAVMERLGTQEGFLLRYDSPDGLEGSEGTFLICTCWLARTCAMQGYIDFAEALIEQVKGAASPQGLLAEEYDPHAGRLQGNYPQAFSHLALVLAILEVENARRHRQS